MLMLVDNFKNYFYKHCLVKHSNSTSVLQLKLILLSLSSNLS